MVLIICPLVLHTALLPPSPLLTAKLNIGNFWWVELAFLLLCVSFFQICGQQSQTVTSITTGRALENQASSNPASPRWAVSILRRLWTGFVASWTSLPSFIAAFPSQLPTWTWVNSSRSIRRTRWSKTCLKQLSHLPQCLECSHRSTSREEFWWMEARFGAWTPSQQSNNAWRS